MRTAIMALAGLLVSADGSGPPRPARVAPLPTFVLAVPPAAAPSSPEAPPRESRCPDRTALVGSSCVDQYEAPNVPGARPLVMYDAIQASEWCVSRGKRLCTEGEWEAACSSKYPYGSKHEEGRCNDGKKWMDRDESKLNLWPSPVAVAEVERIWQGEASGSRPGCVSPYGVYDLTGNVEEWVSSGSSYVLKGCYWAACFTGPKPTCYWTNGVHAPRFKYYTTGFRCCSAARDAVR